MSKIHLTVRGIEFESEVFSVLSDAQKGFLLSEGFKTVATGVELGKTRELEHFTITLMDDKGTIVTTTIWLTGVILCTLSDPTEDGLSAEEAYATYSRTFVGVTFDQVYDEMLRYIVGNL
jgi:hypothetical protein